MTAPNVPVLVSNEFPGSELTGDVLEFIRAMHAYQTRYRRRYPAWSEVLYVLRTLGYAKRVPGAVWATPEQGLTTQESADSLTQSRKDAEEESKQH
jgi:hypothetical protein